jgi:Kef-type K+ transport system membrane component KefB
MSDDTILILALSLLIWLSPYIAKTIKMPTPPVEIILGSLMAYFGILHENDFFELVAEVGFLYLMFLAGMEVNLRQIAKESEYLLKQGIAFIVSLGLLSLAIGSILDFNSIVIISLPLVSIGILASLSKIYGKEERWLKLAVSVGVLGEVASIVALTIVDAASTVGLGIPLFVELLYLALFLISIVVLYRLLHLLFWWYPEIKSALMPKMDTSDQDIRLAMALFFIMISFMLVLHLELALGAFIAGVAISAFFHYNKDLEEKMSSLGFGFLVPLFFIHVGVSFDIKALAIPGVLSGALLITAVMIFIRLLSAFYLRKNDGYRTALSTALALSMPLTLLIAVATIGYESGNIDILAYYRLILSSLLEVIIAMIGIKFIRPMPD